MHSAGIALPAVEARATGRYVGWIMPLVEGGAAVSAALLMVVLSRRIDVDPLDRIGQVSALAALELRFAIISLLLIAVLLVAHRAGGEQVHEVATKLACASLAGMSSALVAGGVLVALRGTRWPLFGAGGDAGQLERWAHSLLSGGTMPASYPPLFVYGLAAWANWFTAGNPAFALKELQILGTALFSTVGYLAWRLLLKPVWALVVGVAAALPLVSPYKPYSNIVLVVLLPMLVVFLQHLRCADSMTWRRLILSGSGLGAAFGVLFLTYSGWYVWSAPGVLAAVSLVFPWRRAPLRGAAFAVLTGAVFVLISLPHLSGLLFNAGSVRDRYFYFDTAVEPAYIAMWKDDLPGQLAIWPPPGELGGVGLFTVVLLVGMGFAITYGLRNTAVIATACCLVSAWLLRFWFASHMFRDKAVQLYPRTTAEILYCLLVLTGLAALIGWERFRSSRFHLSPEPDDPGARDIVIASRPVPKVVGVLAGLMLLFASAGSATADQYMPKDDGSLGRLAWVAHQVPQQEGLAPGGYPP